MNYSEPLYQQIFVFLKAIASGIVIGLFYDVLETTQKIISEKRSVVIVKDLMFCFFASVFSFFFMVLYNNGRARLILFLAQLMGAFVFHICLGKYLAKPVAKTGLFIKKVIFLLFSPFMKIYRKTVELYEKLAFKIKAFTQERKQKQREKKKTEKETAKKGRKKCTPKTKKQKNIRFQ